MGGGWSDPGYLFVIGQYYSAWDRSAANGFRCIYSVGEVAGIPESLSEPIRIKPRRDYTNVQPVSQAEFNLFKRFYDYDPTDLNATVEQTDESSTYWVREKITFNASYGGERITVYLFLPKGAKPPYQTVIHFPGWDATKLASSENLEPRSVMKSIIMSGRAGCFPIFKGTYERRHPEGQKPILGGDWNANREWIIQMVRDLHRSVDYLETRSDINSEKLAYHGLSWGARLGSIMLAMEKRIKVCIFQAGGFHSYEKPAEIDEINFAARVNAPVLMVNGSEDSIFPLESSQLPLYRALGTASTDKKHIIYPGGHELLGLLEAQMRKDILAWLDKYLGPVD
jgi:cephalosporin-C deacetylase-like acetyl esterase